ncbi:MAG: hypothetical protein PHH30_10560 [Bacteroidales bacterium]|nr:hypothetical protein [Bacteroidales bacterium]
MKNRYFFFVMVLFYMHSSAFSQSLEFTEAKTIGDLKTVYFYIEGLDEDESDRAFLLEQLLNDANIFKGRIFTSSSFKTRCQLYLPVSITPEYIRPILISNGYDFDLSSISVDGKVSTEKKPDSYVSKFQSPADGFPTLIYTGDKDNDAEQYRMAKEQWVGSNQKKYDKQRANGTAQYPIVVSKSDFDKFTETKKQMILAEPDKFVIK